MNTFLNEMTNRNNITRTENGDLTHKHTDSKVLDMFALGGAYRTRDDADVILLFKNAMEEDSDLAMKCLFYLRDVLQGQGERRFFRVCYKWLCKAYPAIARRNLKHIPSFGRWDDLIYATDGTKLRNDAFDVIKHQLALDVQSKTPSLLAKWMPSQNASSKATRRLGHELAAYLNMTSRQYRKVLSTLRARINIVERLMSENRWDEIDFSKIPSKSGLIYKNAFARRDILAKKYEAFAKDENTKVNAKALYPYDVAHRAFNISCDTPLDNVDRLMVQKYWDNLPDFYEGKEENAIAVVDVSGSMNGTPMEVAVSLGAYVADKSHGPFANHFITFSSHPEFVRFEGVDIVDKMQRCIRADWGMNTNLQAVFDMLLKTAQSKRVNPKDMPQKLYIISDMEFDGCLYFSPRASYSRWGVDSYGYVPHTVAEVNTGLERIKKVWENAGYTMPKVIFWNVNARNNRIPAIGEGFSYVSGFSASILKTLLSGKDGYDLMIDKLVGSGRYADITG